ncbi:MAG: cache domain-containing protein [Saccharofermentanales bacterium]
MKKVLSRKLTYTYTGIIIAIIIASALAFYQYNLFVLVENGKNNLRQFGVDTMAQVDMQIRSMDVVSVEIASNFDVINALTAIMGGNREDRIHADMVKATIVKSYVNKVNIHRISIFTVQGDLFTTGNTDAGKEEVIKNIFDSQWYGDIVLESGRRVFLPPAPDMWDEASGVKVISLIRSIRSGDEILGYVEVQQKLEVIRNICVNEWDNENLNIAIVGGEDSIFYTNIVKEDAQAYIDEIILKSKINTFRVAETGQELISITDSSFTEYTSYLILEKSVLLKSLQVILYYLLAIVTSLIVLSAFLSTS